jgi:NAD(P)-dependent dehydrogenase (short-subunit alcohol dehydrogenase family)
VARGDSVILFGRRGELLRSLAKGLGLRALAIAGDARDPENLQHAVQLATDRFGGLDGLAHCVGSIHRKPLHRTTPEEFHATIETNLSTAFLASRAALGAIRQRGSGSIVLVSAVAVGQGLNNHEIIAAAKGALEGMVRSAAITYALQGIRFNAVAPALIETPLSADLVPSEVSRTFSESMRPLGRLGKPDEVASVLAFLLGSEAAWVTGQVWGVDGGLGVRQAPPDRPRLPGTHSPDDPRRSGR